MASSESDKALDKEEGRLSNAIDFYKNTKNESNTLVYVKIGHTASDKSHKMGDSIFEC